jgi:hypothetical protein
VLRPAAERVRPSRKSVVGFVQRVVARDVPESACLWLASQIGAVPAAQMDQVSSALG